MIEENNISKKLSSASGFTLVELLITLSIIVILAAVFMTYFRSQMLKGNDARRKADIDRIKIAIEEYEKDHNCYPQYVTCGVFQDQPIYPYLNNVPCDPVKNVSYIYELQGGACPGWYKLYSNLQYIQDPDVKPGIGPSSAFNYVSGSANAPESVQSIAPTGSATTTPSGGVKESQYYGCRSGICVPILWNPARPGPECDPSFQDSNCYGQCGPINVECISVP